MFGSHLSIAGGLHNALIEARDLGMDCVQIFTKNQRQWRAAPLNDEAVRRWQFHRDQTKIRDVVSHDSYLINLASPDRQMREKSISLFREELGRCEALRIPYLVTHPGSHKNDGEESGLKRVVRALDLLHRELSGLRTMTCLEVTAGQGSSLGYRFEQLHAIMNMVKHADRLGVCLDTAHMLEAGYDLTSAQAAKSVLAAFDDLIGLEHVKVIHVNDSKTPRGSRVDRHAHIGHGHVDLGAFKAIVNHRVLRKVPKILETSKEKGPDGRPWDLINLEVLRGLTNRRRTVPAGGGRSRTPQRRSVQGRRPT